MDWGIGLAIAAGAIILAYLFARAIARTEFPFRIDTYGDVPELPDEARVNHMHHFGGDTKS